MPGLEPGIQTPIAGSLDGSVKRGHDGAKFEFFSPGHGIDATLPRLGETVFPGSKIFAQSLTRMLHVKHFGLMREARHPPQNPS
jgi:hypothetical protein